MPRSRMGWHLPGRFAGMLVALTLMLSACAEDPAASTDQNLAQADTELVAVTDAELRIEGGSVERQNNYRLTTPAGTLRLTKIGRLSSIPADLGQSAGSTTAAPGSGSAQEPGDLRPADGYRLMAAEFLVETEPGIAASDGIPTVSLAVDRNTLGELIDVYVLGPNEGTIVASVPDGALSIELIVEFEGVAQSMDFMTGVRTSNNVNSYYDGGKAQIEVTSDNRIDVTTVAPYTASIDGDGECEIRVTGSVMTAYRYPWLDGLGWAPEGATWIAAGVSPLEIEDECTSFSVEFFPTQTAAFFTLFTAASPDPIPVGSQRNDLQIFQAPEDPHAMTLRVAVVGEISGAIQEALLVTLDPDDVPLDFS